MPDSSRNLGQKAQWNESGPWPVDPAAPRPSRVVARPEPRPRQDPEKDGRTPDDRDGNEELERQIQEQPPQRGEGKAEASSGAAPEDGRWVASRRFTRDDELDDTWPNFPARFMD